MAKYAVQIGAVENFLPADQVVAMVGSGKYGDLEGLYTIREDLAAQTLPVKRTLYLLAASVLAFLAFLLVDINANSIHGFYRDRLSQAFLLRREGDRVGVEDDVRLSQLSQPGSLGPYLLINSALNLQPNSDLALRDHKSDFFVFSKLFCGSERTGYVVTRVLEAAYSKIYLNTAMAVSAAAASPNMGRYTNGFVVMLMTLLNVRLGYWIPNPNHLNEDQADFSRVFRDESPTRSSRGVSQFMKTTSLRKTRVSRQIGF